MSIKGNVGIDIASNAYYNVYGEAISEDDLIIYLYDNISQYSVSRNNGKFTEVIPEILAKNNSSASDFTREFFNLLKKV